MTINDAQYWDQWRAILRSIIGCFSVTDLSMETFLFVLFKILSLFIRNVTVCLPIMFIKFSFHFHFLSTPICNFFFRWSLEIVTVKKSVKQSFAISLFKNKLHWKNVGTYKVKMDQSKLYGPRTCMVKMLIYRVNFVLWGWPSGCWVTTILDFPIRLSKHLQVKKQANWGWWC